MVKIPKSALTKFGGKDYKEAENAWVVENNSTLAWFTASDDLSAYLIDIQLAYVPEDSMYGCFAEFFKIPLKLLDYKAYKAAKKEIEAAGEEDDDEDVSDEDAFPEYSEKEWGGLDVAIKINVLEPFLDMESTFDVDVEDFDEFATALKEFGVTVPAKVKNDLKK